MKRQHSLQELLGRQRALTGLVQTHPNPLLTEMAGICGYDFIFLDCEHGVFSETDLIHAMQALVATGALAMVRLAGHDVRALGRYLDMGADAIIVPNVSTAEQARVLARAMNYPPAGTRGFGASQHRETRYGMDLAEHLKAPRDEQYLIVIIESALGVANAEDILAVEGVDGVFVGPSDLSADLGGIGQFSKAAYGEALWRVECAASANGKFLGAPPHPGYPCEALLARGHRLLILGADMALIREAMCAQVAKARSCFQSGESMHEGKE